MKHLSVDIFGKGTGDLEDALREVLKKVEEGYLSGMDSNEDGEFVFQVTEESKNKGPGTSFTASLD